MMCYSFMFKGPSYFDLEQCWRILEKYTYFVNSVTLPVGLSSERVEVSEVIHWVDAVCIIEQEFALRRIFVMVRRGSKYLFFIGCRQVVDRD